MFNLVRNAIRKNCVNYLKHFPLFTRAKRKWMSLIMPWCFLNYRKGICNRTLGEVQRILAEVSQQSIYKCEVIPVGHLLSCGKGWGGKCINKCKITKYKANIFKFLDEWYVRWVNVLGAAHFFIINEEMPVFISFSLYHTTKHIFTNIRIKIF